MARHGNGQTGGRALDGMSSSSSTFAELCGIHTAARQTSIDQTVRLIEATGVELVRFAWCDLHGNLRGKTLVARADRKSVV